MVEDRPEDQLTAPSGGTPRVADGEGDRVTTGERIENEPSTRKGTMDRDRPISQKQKGLRLEATRQLPLLLNGVNTL